MKRNKENRYKSNKEHPGAKIGIVVAEFNSDITNKLLEGAIGALISSKVKKDNIDVVRVPGSFEIPLGLSVLASRKKYDGLIAIGCVIKGGTDHHIYVAGQSSEGVMRVMLDYQIPIGFGIITVNNLKQAKDRCSEKDNKGKDAGEAVLSMLNILKK